MSKIRIKNFGPIKEGFRDESGNDWMDIKKVTVFTGNQGSGKSTVAKLISTLSWIEKALTRGDLQAKKFTTAIFLRILKFQRINNYFKNETSVIEYLGNSYSISYTPENRAIIIKKLTGGNYIMPKIMYVPSERNFLSSISNAFEITGMPENIRNFAEEFRKSQSHLLDEKVPLPINGIHYEYDLGDDASYISNDNYRLNLNEASSGFQSLIPVFLVTKYLSTFVNQTEEILRKTLNTNQLIRMDNEISTVVLSTNDNEERDTQIAEIRKRYFTKCFINIVEEPEQNLFPTSQKSMLESLLEFNNMNEGNKLIMTTHSPYLINFISLAVKANDLKEKVSTDELKNRLNAIVPIASTINPEELVIYELYETDGSIKKLGNFEGIPADKNFLNQSLAEGNRLFDSLLEIEEEL